MARLSLQIKNVASLILATGASVAWGVASKRFFDTPAKPAGTLALMGSLLLLAQLGLLFIESKEEEELSLIRQHRIDGISQRTKLATAVVKQIEIEINAGNHERVATWLGIKDKL